MVQRSVIEQEEYFLIARKLAHKDGGGNIVYFSKTVSELTAVLNYKDSSYLHHRLAKTSANDYPSRGHFPFFKRKKVMSKNKERGRPQKDVEIDWAGWAELLFEKIVFPAIEKNFELMQAFLTLENNSMGYNINENSEITFEQIKTRCQKEYENIGNMMREVLKRMIENLDTKRLDKFTIYDFLEIFQNHISFLSELIRRSYLPDFPEIKLQCDTKDEVPYLLISMSRFLYKENIEKDLFIPI